MKLIFFKFKKNSSLFFSKTSIIILLFLILFSSCDNDEETFTPQTITPIVIAHSPSGGVSFPFFESFSNSYNNEVDWLNFKTNNWYSYSNYPATVSAIDFNQNTVIVCVDEARPTPGYSITINSITELQNNIVVDVEYIESPSSAQIPTRPSIIVKIPKTSKPIVFE